MSVETDGDMFTDELILIPDDESLIADMESIALTQTPAEIAKESSEQFALLGIMCLLLGFLILLNVCVWNRCFKHVDGASRLPPQPSPLAFGLSTKKAK